MKRSIAYVFMVCLAVLAGLAACTLGGCATANAQSVMAFSPDDRIARGFLELDGNLQGYIGVGKLDPKDDVAGCVHNFVIEAGLLKAPDAGAPAFTPQTDTALGKLAVLYVDAKQIEKMKGDFKVSSDCKAVVGGVMLDLVRTGVNLAPGASNVLNILRR